MTKCLSLWSYVALNYKCCIFLTRLSPVGLEGVAHKSLISKEGTQRHIFFSFFPSWVPLMMKMSRTDTLSSHLACQVC